MVVELLRLPPSDEVDDKGEDDTGRQNGSGGETSRSSDVRLDENSDASPCAGRRTPEGDGGAAGRW